MMMRGTVGGLHSTWTWVDGVRLHARCATDAVAPGPPVVLVHGLGVSSRYFIPTARLLAREHRVYAPDLPGTGRSEKPRRILDIDGLGDALGAWMRATGLANASLIGNSLGCQTIAALTLRHPDLVGRAVLIGPTTEARALFWLLHSSALFWLVCISVLFRKQIAVVCSHAGASIGTPA